MEGSSAASSVSADDGPESWEVADVETSVRRLLLSSIKDSNLGSKKLDDAAETSDSGLSVSTVQNSGPSGISDDLINTVDQFLREAIQNPRERVSVLRLEQDIENFIRDSTREQMEFQQLPTSYLRLAAHRVAQHYSLQSMVLTDLPEGSGSRIIVRKTSNIRLPLVRLAEIPVNLPTEESGTVKVAIKQRPRKGQLSSGSPNSHPVRSNSLKSVEERKEEYNKARARIFNGSSSAGKLESDSRIQDTAHRGPAVIKKEEDRTHSGLSDSALSRSSSDIPTSSSRLHRNKTEKEVMGRPKTNNRVAIFRDREVDRKDPDYDRSYDR
ncbi:hypothetical protein M569_04838 [Genlisea aurea]|uniref:R3H domain-containing protein n=1 Tax=Genlisea aurea TaxID=192259 RepID=S8CSV9_9LAMI|nr:hypothetical protein M569_04838 [Genlisea aurea]